MVRIISALILAVTAASYGLSAHAQTANVGVNANASVSTKATSTIGQKVDKGTPLLILEAMKMEHMLRAPRAGTVASIACTVGETVTEGTELLKLAGEEEG